jgi:VWFA-related protein
MRMLLLAAALGLVPAQSAPIRSGVDLVRLSVTVTDRDGQVVRGLTKDAFAVTEDAASRPVAQFAADRVPLTLVVALDLSTSMQGRRIEQARAAVLVLFDRLQPGDEFVVIGFNDTVFNITGGTKVRAEVSRALARAHPSGATALYDAVQAGVRLLDRGDRPRKALVIISDGRDAVPSSRPASMTMSQADERGLTEARESAAQLSVRRSEASLYAIALNADSPLGQDVPALERLTAPSGGITIPVGSDEAAAAAAARVGDELRGQYVLGFEPTAIDGRLHRVNVTVPSCGGCRARARAVYLAARRAR